MQVERALDGRYMIVIDLEQLSPLPPNRGPMKVLLQRQPSRHFFQSQCLTPIKMHANVVSTKENKTPNPRASPPET
jgi:hypothetical protein